MGWSLTARALSAQGSGTWQGHTSSNEDEDTDTQIPTERGHGS